MISQKEWSLVLAALKRERINPRTHDVREVAAIAGNELRRVVVVLEIEDALFVWGTPSREDVPKGLVQS